ncbi:alkaline phosphatase family protein [Cupriavidus sp. CV2]|uniref:alkaline phosphatase family protein n=1 Tax=Cupriavidus ulmosensis TaxID=3065913 RepID=UPI00296B149B|nr:alkaline phosphatase family protein [Cupriavidus sp. CV2]MDW3686968.1 alkaline phosphatase family protein [Cupriavidus sp. CV2]
MSLTASAAITLALLLTGCSGYGGGTPGSTSAAPGRTIIMVWDGLRPDAIDATDTPNLYALKTAGVEFTDNHATYPTFTMMNGASFATGAFPRTSGFYGNMFWTPPQGSAHTIPAGKAASGSPQSYTTPVFTEDYLVLATLNAYYGSQLLLVKSLFKAAQDAGLTTAAIGKSGAAYIQDLARGGYFVDENTVLPRGLVSELQAAGYTLPANTVHGYSGTDAVTLAAGNGSPTARAGYVTFNTTRFDPAGAIAVSARDSADRTQGAPEDAANQYMMQVYTGYILPRKKPDLSVIWFRTPDNVEHGYGPGTANYKAGLRSQDARLGELMAALRNNQLDSSTNLIVVSDHGHSSVSGPVSVFPLLGIAPSASRPNGANLSAAAVGAPDPVHGYSFSGDVRSADLLWYRGFKAYDGAGCATSAMAGIKADGTASYAVQVDATGALCGKPNTPYMAISANPPTGTAPRASFAVPAAGTLEPDGIVVATNGGSDYFYVPGHDQATVARLVRFLQQRQEYGAVFVDSRYLATGLRPAIQGVLPMSMVNLESATRQDNGQPDVVVSFSWDSAQAIQGVPGIEFESFAGQRGMHGSFSPADVHNTLIAKGPAFQSGLRVAIPSGNVDVAPTVAYLLGQSLPRADGRILNEALVAPARARTPTVAASVMHPASAASGLRFETLTDLTGRTTDDTLTGGSYTINLNVKDLSVDGKTYRYFDSAQAVRQ